MMVLIIGGSGSGKSFYAEKMAGLLSKEDNPDGVEVKKYYLATMQVCDQEGYHKVERHRKMRDGKGFLTIEQPTAIHRALEKMEEGERIVLLECISNLAANEMFLETEPISERQVVEIIFSGIELLKENTTHLVVVSNNIFDDGIIYDKTTTEYIRAMAELNGRLAGMADQVVEAVAGIPVIIKQ